MNSKKSTRVVSNKTSKKSGREDDAFYIKSDELQIGFLETSEEMFQNETLSRAKLQWYLGDWEALASLPVEDPVSPQYGLLCLMKAAALQQTGDLEGTLEFATLAKQNNVDNQLLKQILVGGLYQTLGRIHAIRGEYEKAHVKIRKGISLVKRIDDVESGIISRFAREVSTYGSNDLAIGMIKQSLPKKPNAMRPSELSKKLDQVNIAINSLKSQTNDPLKIVNNLKMITPGDVLMKRAEKSIVLVAGMRHSGSTVLFNIIRIASELSGLSVIGDYSERIESIKDLADTCQVLIVKTHEYRDDIADMSNFTLTTIRDLRDSVASAKRRKFVLLDKVGGPIEYAKSNRSLHDVWSQRSDFIFEYETFMQSPFQVIQKILAALELDSKFTDEIYQRVTSLPTDNYSETLLSDTHITDPKRELNYRLSLEPTDILKIEEQHKSWLKKYSYTKLPS